jgi:hypothetical protein
VGGAGFIGAGGTVGFSVAARRWCRHWSPLPLPRANARLDGACSIGLAVGPAVAGAGGMGRRQRGVQRPIGLSTLGAGAAALAVGAARRRDRHAAPTNRHGAHGRRDPTR